MARFAGNNRGLVKNISCIYKTTLHIGVESRGEGGAGGRGDIKIRGGPPMLEPSKVF